jgi:hypothetical protein
VALPENAVGHESPEYASADVLAKAEEPHGLRNRERSSSALHPMHQCEGALESAEEVMAGSS